MTSAKVIRDEGPFPRPAGRSHVPMSGRKAKHTNGGPELMQPSGQVLQQRVLHVLIEEFGGEATGSTLARCLSTLSRSIPPAVSPGLIDALQALERIGALDLETDGPGDVVVRLLPQGAEAQIGRL